MKGACESALLLWRARTPFEGHTRELRCTLEQLGEGCFELRLVAGHAPLRCETFVDAAQALQRAEGLRVELQAAARGGTR